MEWTLEAFYEDGGTTTFIDRVSASLGIHASSIKIVGVYEGSLIVDYNIYSDNDNTAELEAISFHQTELIATNAIDLGAPVLDFTANSEPVVSDGVVSAAGYEPIRITVTTSNDAVVEDKFATNTQQTFQQKDSADETSVFNPDIMIVEDEQQQQTQEEAAIRLAGEQNNLPIIMIGGLVLVVMVVIALVCRVLLNYHKRQSIDIKRMTQVKAEYENQEAKEFSQFRSPSKAKNMVGPHQSMEMHNTMSKMVVEYVPQYDANHDFAIFGTAQGGVQTLQQKMNLADDNTESTADKQSSSNANNSDKQSSSNANNTRTNQSGQSTRPLAEDREMEVVEDIYTE
jgi:hypothetical protein